MDKQYSTLNQSFNASTNRSHYNYTTKPQTSRSRIMSLGGTQSLHRGDLGKHTLRQAGMTTIFKGIKDNDVSKVVGEKNMTQLPTIRKGSFVYQSTEKEGDSKFVHKNLIGNRKKYDQLKNEVKSMQNQLDLLREDNEQLKKREKQMDSQMYNVKVSEAYENDCATAKGLYENSYWTYKSYQHMKRRLKDDLTSYELRQNKINEELRLTDFKLKQADVQTMQSQQFNYATQQMMNNMLDNIEEEQRVRETELDQFREVHRKKQELDHKNNEREAKQKYISEHAMHDKDGQEKKWRNLLLVHQFVNQMFKAKMDRELKKFELVEQAYQKIKQSTGVSDAQQIVDKFLTREQTYGELLASISEYEKKIENLKKQKETSDQKLDELKQELTDMEMNKKNKHGTALDHNLHKKLETVNDQKQRVEVEKERIYQWCIQTLAQIHKIGQLREQREYNDKIEEERLKQQESQQDQNSQNGDVSLQQQQDTIEIHKKPQFERVNFYEQYPREKFLELFNTTVEQLNEIQGKQNEEEVRQIQMRLNKTNPEQETNQEDFYSRNTRIVPPVRKRNLMNATNGSKLSFQSQDSKSERVNTQGDSFVGDSQSEGDDDGFRDELDEQEYIGNLREDIVREKEMQLRKKKFEEDKKNQQKYNRMYDNGYGANQSYNNH